MMELKEHICNADYKVFICYVKLMMLIADVFWFIINFLFGFGGYDVE